LTIISNKIADVGLDMCIDRDKGVPTGIHGIRTGKGSNFFRFKEMGGFFPENIKVSNGNFIGKQKNQILDFICSCLKDRTRSIDRLKTIT
jgi:hypothetical protein